MKARIWLLVSALVCVAALVAVSGPVIGLLRSPVSCAEQRAAAKARHVLEAQYSPPLERLEMRGTCGDFMDNSYWGIDARVASAGPEAAAKLLDTWGCRSLPARKPIYADLDRRASLRHRCTLPDVGRVRIAVEPHGLTSPRAGPGVALVIVVPGAIG